MRRLRSGVTAPYQLRTEEGIGRAIESNLKFFDIFLFVACASFGRTVEPVCMLHVILTS